MSIWLAASVFVAAASGADSGCGWTGLELAPPDVVVRGSEVRLGEPLRILRVEEDAPAGRVGLEPRMEILSIDGLAWDAGGFLPNLVRLQTVAPGEVVRITARQGTAERAFRLRAEPCTDEQAHRRARLLANLGRIEGAAYGRSAERESLAGALGAEERRAFERAMEEHADGIREARRRMEDPRVRRQIQEAMLLAEEAERRALVGREEYEDALRRARDQQRLAQEAMSQEAMRREREAAERMAALRRQSLEGMEAEEMLRKAMMLEAGEAARRSAEAMREAMGRLRDDLDRVRIGRDHVIEALEEERARLEETRRLEQLLLGEQIRRALAEAEKGQAFRRQALREAWETSRLIRHAGAVVGQGEFQAVGPGLARYVQVDHGLLVLHLAADSPLAGAGVSPGDVIVAAGGRPVHDLGDLFEAVAAMVEEISSAGEALGRLELEVHDPSGRRTVSLPVTALWAVGPV